MKEKVFRAHTIILIVCLALSLILNGYLYYRLTILTERHSPTFFSFVFSPTMQNITNGNLYLNLTFDVVEGNLTVRADVNKDSYSPDAVLALQFDSDNNGTIDIRYWEEEDFYVYRFLTDDSQFLLRADNSTTPSDSVLWGWLPDGTIYISSMIPSGFWDQVESPFHYCSYSGSICTFFFTFPTKPTDFNLQYPHGWLNGEHGIQGKLVRVLYGIAPPRCEWPIEDMTVYVPPFNFVE